jgi:hypothetical protein
MFSLSAVVLATVVFADCASLAAIAPLPRHHGQAGSSGWAAADSNGRASHRIVTSISFHVSHPPSDTNAL